MLMIVIMGSAIIGKFGFLLNSYLGKELMGN